MKEIGGYFELEQLKGQEYYAQMIRFNLGRTALLSLLDVFHAEVLWVPYFLCDSVTNACEKAGITLHYYNIDAAFLPILDIPVEEGAYLYLINIYGQLSQETILGLAKKYQRIICDNTHAFFQAPAKGVPTLYSLRKYFGLSDGAYVSEVPGLAAYWSHLERDQSHGRMEHVLGRLEEEASAYYQTMLRNARKLEEEPPRQMSAVTENLLRGIDYDFVKKRRESNYRQLEDLLGDQNPLTLTAGAGPFCYPYYSREGLKLRRAMAAEKIYIPVYWDHVLQTMPEDSLEYDYAANILPLPCDQRYGREEMQRIVQVLVSCQTDLRI